MKAAISVLGRFHAFDLASQLEQRGSLEQLITSYPTYLTRRWNIADSAVSSAAHIEVVSRAWHRLKGGRLANPQLFFARWFDDAARARLRPGADIFVGWSSVSLATMRRAKALGMRTIIERGSSHIEYQTRILTEEFARWGQRFDQTHPGIIERELQEYAEADRIAVPSMFAKTSFIAAGVPASRLIQVPYGASLQAFRPTGTRVDDGIFRVVHCGALSLRKGIPYLLEAWRQLALPKAELWLIGRSSPEIEPVLRQYRDTNVVLKGTVPQHTLRDLYVQCSVFCAASLEEGLAMVIPQALACGLPVVCTENTGGGDIVRPGVDGFVVPARDVEALKAKLLMLYENHELRDAMAAASTGSASSHLSWSRYGEAIVAEYRALAAAPC